MVKGASNMLAVTLLRFPIAANFVKKYESCVRTKNCPLLRLRHGWHYSQPCHQNNELFSGFVRRQAA